MGWGAKTFDITRCEFSVLSNPSKTLSWIEEVKPPVTAMRAAVAAPDTEWCSFCAEKEFSRLRERPLALLLELFLLRLRPLGFAAPLSY